MPTESNSELDRANAMAEALLILVKESNPDFSENRCLRSLVVSSNTIAPASVGALGAGGDRCG